MRQHKENTQKGRIGSQEGIGVDMGHDRERGTETPINVGRKREKDRNHRQRGE